MARKFKVGDIITVDYLERVRCRIDSIDSKGYIRSTLVNYSDGSRVRDGDVRTLGFSKEEYPGLTRDDKHRAAEEKRVAKITGKDFTDYYTAITEGDSNG